MSAIIEPALPSIQYFSGNHIMNAIVEVAALEMAAQVNEVVVVATVRSNFTVEVPAPVATSTLRAVISVGSHSISAVAPDHTFEGGLAKAVA